MRDGGCPAGSGRSARLDPFALPARFSASDAAADGRVRQVELHCERVVVRRSLAGMRMALNMPVKAFAGVALKLTIGEGPATLDVVLAHKDDPALDLPLYRSAENDEALTQWQSWGAVLGLPLLVDDESEGWREAYPRAGMLKSGTVRPRRRRRSALCKRRPSILLRRAPRRLTGNAPVHRGEREIIARN
jgi:hypothetical protein